MNMQQCHISGITKKKNCNEVKAKWRTCPIGELAPVSPTTRLCLKLGKLFYKMAAISKVIRLSQKLRGTEPSTLTLCIGFVGRIFLKKYCWIQQTIVSAILQDILQKMATIFNVMRVIFETMRQRNVTVVSTHISYGQYNSDSALLRASHNCGHNLSGCWLWLFVQNNNWYNGWCRICKCFFTFNKHRWWDQSVHPLNR